ncbi:hypothetical protein [Deinococcus sp. ME38]|uniref:hypothetical protein n=1 Tax=Deinococcus sp. ME38 TaxID=3400344 RepID=UPI003B5C9FA3
MTATLTRSTRAFLVGATLLPAALGVSGTGHTLQVCPECVSVQLFDPCLGC